MVRDMYEDSMVYLARSDIPGAGQGLFARKNVPLNIIMAFFNGLKIPNDVDYTKDLFAFDEVSYTTIVIHAQHVPVCHVVHEGVHYQVGGGLNLLP